MKPTLTINDVHLWATKPKEISNPELLKRYQGLLNDEELHKQQRYRFKKDQHSALITRAFVRDILSQYTEKDPAEILFSKGNHGKPELKSNNSHIQFNISHTRGLIICAVTLHDEVGCDVEDIHRNSDVLAIANRYFSEQEITQLFLLPTEQQRSRFFDLWTLKESYIKAWGLGLAIPLADFSFHIDPTSASPHTINTNISLSFASHRNDHADHWSSWLLYPNDEYRIALSIKNKGHHKLRKTLTCFKSTPLVCAEKIQITSI